MSGIDAIAVARSFAPDVAVVDIGLPGMDGYELASHLGNAALIALTGYGREQDVKRSLGIGFRVHLVKPVELTVLLDTIERV
jgi:CheY-like chemotaxis protein